MTAPTGEVYVRVPATSANLGPGFDSLGLALDLHDEVTASVSDRLEITVDGADEVPTDERHLVYRSMVEAFTVMGVSTPGLRLHCRNRIPHGRGLGSSSAAIVAGALAARALLPDGEQRMGDNELFALAARIEGHPDNVASAVFGGLTISWAEDDSFRTTRLDLDPELEAVVAVPDRPVATEIARGLIPQTIPHAEAAANSGRAALLVAALTKVPDLLLPATRDWLHQGYRRPAMPETLQVIEALRSQGVPAIVSGAGPTVLAFARSGDDSVVEAMDRAAPRQWNRLRLPLSRHGGTTRRMSVL